MHLLQAWKDALAFARPKSFNLFALVTLQTIGRAYWYLVTYWGWLMALLIAYPVSRTYFKSSMLVHAYIFNVYAYIALPIYAMLIMLSARPSVKRKTFAYYSSYFVRHAWYLCIVFFIGLWLYNAINNVIFDAFLQPITRIWIYRKSTVLFLSPALVGRFVLPFFTFMSLFYLDSPGDLLNLARSVIRATKMLIFNYPLCLIMYCVFAFLPFHTIGFAWYPPEAILFLPIPICFFTNLYVKKIHEQTQLYFRQPRG